DERRGTPTMHTKLPLGVTVLTGDFLFAQSAALAAEAESVPVVQVFSDALVNICRGEILQAQTRWKVPDLALYQQRIYGKTAALFEAAALSPALLSPDDDTSVEAFKSFGREVGMAYQIVDDALDFMATTETLGKPAGHDLREGHITLPAMLYIADNDIAADDFVAEARDKAKVGELIRVIREEKAPQRALQVAHEHIENAKAVLSDVKWSPAVDELIELADYVIARDF
ncbi:MAG: polyprenyl synthetase family protein, partial [Chloroflexi bacterium]|nr:polyprenyl synthetase family protein [Chloroflexota bacterium]